MSHFDLLIVGAGPAGSFAAELLASHGAKVALFDGRPPAEPKACGGGVTAKALKAWPRLLNAVGRTIDELDLYSPPAKDCIYNWTSRSRFTRAWCWTGTYAIVRAMLARKSSPKNSPQEK